jgi:thiamine biosynthesis lipoprotein
MGSALTVTAPDEVIGPAWIEVERIFATVERALTRFDASSALSRLNRAAGSDRWQPVPAVLARALLSAHRAGTITNGLFDARIIGALEAAGERAHVRLPPSPPSLQPGERWLSLERHPLRARLATPIDLGGIGKGLALRWAAAAVRSLGLERFLIEAGGDLVAGAPPPGERAWTVAIEQPGAADPAALIDVRDGAVATSSIAVRHWLGPNGEPAHHLIDPRTGRPADTGVTSVTVAAADPAWAEVWAKAAFIGGPEVVAGRAAWVVAANGTLRMTEAATHLTGWRRAG